MTELYDLRFKGTFRDYQQRILNEADKFLENGKINIVAAPGSGKTILGLELIRRLNSPCIILSPTTAIREQWGTRFKESFLEDENDFPSLFSDDLRRIATINSITYQALYSAVEKQPIREKDEYDYSDIDLFATIKKAGIGTICLDEAHHLKNEWQKALEKFISALGSGVKIISLTATPPYDSDVAAWERYSSVCGEIDAEIFVPELVGQKNLCPHQDYIYFNYPDMKETEYFREHTKHAMTALGLLGKSDVFSSLSERLNHCPQSDYDSFFSSAKGYTALLSLLRFYGYEVDKKLVKLLTAKRGLPKLDLAYAETAIRFLLEGDLITEKQKEEIVAVLRENCVYEKKKVNLLLNDRLKRTLISSVGKLDSIARIVGAELSSMKEKLRMLILTDYIRKDDLSRVATEEKFSSVNVVSIFETVRRTNPDAKLGVLSGTLVILPASVDLSETKYKAEPLAETEYVVVNFGGDTRRSVEFVGSLFEKGLITVLIGTKSLLGEGWDSPCINSLILASFVGSFVLSNQMRGRAIRTDKNDPDKTANIWHLVTVEPEHLFYEKATDRVMAYLGRDKNEIDSYDFEVLKRRFTAFMGPDYKSGVIQSGIERISVIQPPFDKRGFERINEQTLALAANREDVKNKWGNQVIRGNYRVGAEIDIPEEKRIPPFCFTNFGLYFLLALTEGLCVAAAVRSCILSNPVAIAVSLLLTLLMAFPLALGIKKLLILTNPAKSFAMLGTAVYRALCECGLISSGASVITTKDKNNLFVFMRLQKASIHDQNVFNTAITELLSPIENPKYIIIAKNSRQKYNYALSFACPTELSKNKESVRILAANLETFAGRFEPVYTRTENGREFILKCRRNSYITFNRRMIDKKFRVSDPES